MNRVIISLSICLCLSFYLQAQWTTAVLSQARWDLGVVSVSNKVVFAGGKTLSGAQVTPSSRVDIYDRPNISWTTGQLSQARSQVAAFALGSKAFFCGGLLTGNSPSNRIDIYESSNDTWSTAQLFLARFPLAAIAHNHQLLLAGGLSATAGYSNVVDIYNSQTESWSTGSLSVPRIVGAVAAVGNKILFAGGYNSVNIIARVDIYDTETGAWSTAELSEPRANIAALTIGNKVFFAGGDYPGQAFGTSLTVDVYDANTQTWATATLDQQRAGIVAAAIGNTGIFAGGYRKNNNDDIETFDFVDIVNSNSGAWTATDLSQNRVLLQADRLGERVFFSGDAFIFGKTVATQNIDIYHAPTQSWTTNALSAPRYWARSAVAGNQLFIAGGLSAEGIPSNVVDIYTDLTVDLKTPNKLEGIKLFPNPLTTHIGLELSPSLLPAHFMLMDAQGRLLMEHKLESLNPVLSVDKLPAGIYFALIHNATGEFREKIVVKE